MRARFRRAGVIVAACALAACTSGADEPSTASDAKIGVLAPLSGANAAAGREALQGAELAVKLINEQDAVITSLTEGAGPGGVTGQRFTLVSADTVSDPGTAATAAARLVSQERVAGLIGAYDPAVTAAASQRTERLEVPFVNGDSSATHLTDRGLDWFFRVGPTDRMLGEALFSVLQQQEAAGAETRRIAILHPDDKPGVEIAATLRALAAEGGYSVAAAVAFQPGTEDLAGAVTRIRGAEPNAVFLVASSTTDARRLVGAFGQLDYTPPGIMALGSGFAGPAFVKAAGANAEGLFRSVAWSQALAARNTVAAAVTDQYAQTYNTPMTETSAGTFMAVVTLAQGISGSDGQGAQQIRTTLSALSEPGRSTIAPWNGIEFDTTRQNAAAAGAVEQLRGGQAQVVFPREIAAAAAGWPLAEVRG